MEAVLTVCLPLSVTSTGEELEEGRLANEIDSQPHAAGSAIGLQSRRLSFETTESSGSKGIPEEIPETQATKILLVEDSPDVSQILGDLLRSDGFDVETASDGVTALQRLAGRMPHLCILDIGLPGLDGYELADRFGGCLPGVPSARLLPQGGEVTRTDNLPSRLGLMFI